MDPMALPKQEENKRRRGRQRIPMAWIEDQDRRDIAYCKRRKGLFSKAAELCAISGAHVSVLAFSRGRRAFAFGHPSFDAVLRRFLLCHPEADAGPEDAEDTMKLLLATARGSALEPDQTVRLEKLHCRVVEMQEVRGLVLAKLSERMRMREDQEEAMRQASIAMMEDFSFDICTVDAIPIWARD